MPDGKSFKHVGAASLLSDHNYMSERSFRILLATQHCVSVYRLVGGTSLSGLMYVSPGDTLINCSECYGQNRRIVTELNVIPGVSR